MSIHGEMEAYLKVLLQDISSFLGIGGQLIQFWFWGTRCTRGFLGEGGNNHKEEEGEERKRKV